MIAATGPTPLWYATRSSGYVSLLMLTAILVLGILTSMRWSNRDWPRFVSQALHRNLSLLVLVFLLIHIVTSVADPFAGISVLNAVAPFTGSYRPLWLGFGVVSLELLVALTITSLVRGRLGFRVWRVVHWMAYACWPLAELHTLGTGSDVRSGWGVLIGLACVGVVVVAVAWRLMGAQSRLTAAVRSGGVLLTAAATASLLGFAAAGPLRAGWAKAAGTPPNLLTANGSGPSATPAPAAPLQAGLADDVAGTLVQGDDAVQVELSDHRDTGLRITITVPRRSQSGLLTITENGTSICSAQALLLQDVIATCGSISVDISLSGRPGGAVAGTMTTQKARQ